MKQILLVVLLTGVGVIQTSFNPLLLKGTTEALIQAVDGLTKPEAIAQSKTVQAKQQVESQKAKVTQMSLTDAEKKLYEDCAPFWGLMYLEQGIAEQWYRLSPKHMYQDIPVEQLAAMKNAGIALENNPIESLIVQMYHIPGTAGSFAITSAPDNPVRLFTAKDIGSLLHIVSTAFDKRGNIKHEGQFKAALEDRLYRYLLDQPDGMKINQNTESKRYKKDNGKAFTKKDFGHFVNALVGAIVDCQKETSVYPKSTPQQLLISYMLAKSESKDHIQEYMRGLLGDELFVLSDEKYTKQEIDQILKQKQPFENLQDFYDYTIASIYEQNYHSLFPKIATFNNNINYKGSLFTNCVESMMQNLINIATYNHKKYQMGYAPKDVTLHSKLQDFYESNPAHKDNTAVDSIGVQQQWIDLFENQEGIIYKKVVSGQDQSKALDVLDGYDGFIKVSDALVEGLPVKIIKVNNVSYQVYEKTIGTKKYVLVPAKSGLECFEMRGRPSNIVMMMSKLLNMNFTMSVDDIFDLETVTEKFQTMCDALGWTVSAQDLEQIKQQVDPLNIKVTKDKGSFLIELDNKHGIVEINQGDARQLKIQNYDQFVRADKEIVALGVGCGLFDGVRLLEEILQNQKLFGINRYIKLREIADNQRFVRVLCMADVIDYDYIEKMMVRSILFEEMFVFNEFFWELLANPSKHASFIDAVKNMLVFLSKTDKIADFLDIYIQDDFSKLQQVVDILSAKDALDNNTMEYILGQITTASKGFDSDAKDQAYQLLVSIIDQNNIKATEVNRISSLLETLYKKLSYGMRKEHLEEYNAMLEKLKKGNDVDVMQPKVVPVQHAKQSKMIMYERERYDSQEQKTLEDVSGSDDTLLVR